MNGTATRKMACYCATVNGGRCRHIVEGRNTCSDHKTDGRQIKPADVVLLKVNINRKALHSLRGLGVRMLERNEQEINQKHVEHAQQHGRKADSYREIADSGVPVFGKDGVRMAHSGRLLEELKESGYWICDAHIFQKEKQIQSGMATLVIQLERVRSGGISSVVLEKVRRMLSDTFEFTHVWSNPPQHDGRRVDTVNLSHRMPDARPELELTFDVGLWNASELA